VYKTAYICQRPGNLENMLITVDLSKSMALISWGLDLSHQNHYLPTHQKYDQEKSVPAKSSICPMGMRRRDTLLGISEALLAQHSSVRQSGSLWFASLLMRSVRPLNQYDELWDWDVESLRTKWIHVVSRLEQILRAIRLQQVLVQIRGQDGQQSLNKPSFVAWSTPPPPYHTKRDHLSHVSNAAGALIRHTRGVFACQGGVKWRWQGLRRWHTAGGARVACQQYEGRYQKFWPPRVWWLGSGGCPEFLVATSVVS
jgi:hypothetical protein